MSRINPADTSWTRPAITARAITASATPIPGGPTRGLYLGTAGSLTVTFVNGDTVTFANLAAGVVHPLSVTHVTASVGAADVVALF